MSAKPVQTYVAATTLEALLKAIKGKTIAPRPDYIKEVTGKTSAQA